MLTLYYDTQDSTNPGWAYKIVDGPSGSIDGNAAKACDDLTNNEPTKFLGDLVLDICDIENGIDLESVYIVPPGGECSIYLGELLLECANKLLYSDV